MFNDKKSSKAKIFFFFITNNSNWEILKDKMVLRMKNLNILDVHWKIQILGRSGGGGGGGGLQKTNIEGGIA